MPFYLNTKNNSVHLVFTRNGSSLLLKLSNQHSFFELIPSLGKVIKHLNANPNTPIYITFRDPEVRFRSGLEVNLSKTNNNQNTLSEYKNCLAYTKNLHKFHNEIYYHLFDIHLDHTLWAPLLLSSYGYNVQLVSLNLFSQHLLEIFPDSTDIIKTEERPASFDTSSASQLELWDAYQNVMFEDTNPYTFNDWMKIEKEIFTVYKNSLTTGIARDLLAQALNDSFYFTDFYSPKTRLINSFLTTIHLNKNPLPELQELSKLYGNTLQNIQILKNGQKGIDTDPKV